MLEIDWVHEANKTVYVNEHGEKGTDWKIIHDEIGKIVNSNTFSGFRLNALKMIITGNFKRGTYHV